MVDHELFLHELDIYDMYAKLQSAYSNYNARFKLNGKQFFKYIFFYSTKLTVCISTHSIRNIFFIYFGVKLRDRDRLWASHPRKNSYVCLENLMSKGKKGIV